MRISLSIKLAAGNKGIACKPVKAEGGTSGARISLRFLL
jgi:hypothetical protein